MKKVMIHLHRSPLGGIHHSRNTHNTRNNNASSSAVVTVVVYTLTAMLLIGLSLLQGRLMISSEQQKRQQFTSSVTVLVSGLSSSSSTTRPPRPPRPSVGRTSDRGSVGRDSGRSGRSGGRGRGRGPGRGRGNSNSNSNDDLSSINQKKRRKQNRRSKAEAGTNRKLQADANFFWDCISKRARGMDIAGVSGKPFALKSRNELFGKEAVAKTSTSLSQENIATTEEAKVTRSGGAMSILPMDDFGGDKLELPEFVLQNLLRDDRMRYKSPSPIQRYANMYLIFRCSTFM